MPRSSPRNQKRLDTVDNGGWVQIQNAKALRCTAKKQTHFVSQNLNLFELKIVYWSTTAWRSTRTYRPCTYAFSSKRWYKQTISARGEERQRIQMPPQTDYVPHIQRLTSRVKRLSTTPNTHRNMKLPVSANLVYIFTISQSVYAWMLDVLVDSVFSLTPLGGRDLVSGRTTIYLVVSEDELVVGCVQYSPEKTS